jgi:integrase
VLWRKGDKGRRAVPGQRLEIIDNTALSEITANLHLLGAAAEDGGLADEQAMRIIILVARTGRRISEILMLDRDPLLPLEQPPGSDAQDGGFVAKLRYQQTKIEQAPDIMLVDAEIVAIVAEQQRWVDQHVAPVETRGQARLPFPRRHVNRNADRYYPPGRLWHVLSEFVRQLGIHDAAGRLIDFNRTHRFRHTKATSLLNAGVPLHVVQRYMGHLSPTMTMNYAQTLAATHEAELRRRVEQLRA